MQKNKIDHKPHIPRIMIFLAFSIIAGCRPTSAVETEAPAALLESATITTSPTVMPSATPIPSTPTPTRQSTICSPLASETLETIQEIISNPYKQPRVGIDDGPPTHHGVDFSHYSRNGLSTVEGVGVQSVLDGEVVTIIDDKFPYGYALIVETPLDSINPMLLAQIDPPALAPTVVPDPKFLWVPQELPFALSKDSRSLYILYAHLQQLPAVTVGESISCRQILGYVGNTGDSSNPHLHFEIRIGPSGARFESMAYYNTHATESERYNYIVWRVSNLFQLFDPMKILDIKG